MIEGLRLLPWFQEAISRDLLGAKSKCETCMESLSEDQRQLAKCGYAPPLTDSRAPFADAWHGLGYSGPKPTVCPGYSTSLPETIEIARARLHWSKGSLREFCGGQSTDALMLGIEICEGAINECQSWSMANREKK